jgi:hypothetical protein
MLAERLLGKLVMLKESKLAEWGKGYNRGCPAFSKRLFKYVSEI